MRRVRELTELAADEEYRLLADVDGVFADPLEAPRDDEHARTAAHVHPDALRRRVQARGGAEVARVLFVCVQNAGRSQMAEALFRLAGEGHEARSAGTRPAARVHSEVVKAMGEVGVDLSGKRPQRLERGDAEWADIVVTMGCGDECPVVPGKRYVDWELEDPAGRPLDEVRAVRDEIARRVADLLAQL